MNEKNQIAAARIEISSYRFRKESPER